MFARNPELFAPGVDLSALCFTGATVYLRHSWGILACKRCGKLLPSLSGKPSARLTAEQLNPKV